MKRTIFYIAIVIAAFMVTCKKPFAPNVTSTDSSYLVVEGFIYGGTDSTFVKLSRTVKVSTTNTNKPETGAAVTVEDNQNNTYTIKESVVKGYYNAPPLGLADARTYRLRIKTSDGLVYLSDFVPVKNAPPIDSIGHTVAKNGMYVYLNTHDPANNTRYYRWDFGETWRFSAQYVSANVVSGTQVVQRTAAQQVYYCFNRDSSQTVLLGSSITQSQDIINQAPITFIDSLSEKVELRYSILIKQYALTKDAYDFWQNLKNNTENLGSIFDAQPSTSSGNIHCTTNPDVPVIGYIGAGKVAQKRVFIDKSVLPHDWITAYPYDCAFPDTAYFNPPAGKPSIQKNLIDPPVMRQPLFPVLNISGILVGYTEAFNECADCTIRGKAITPPYWK